MIVPPTPRECQLADGRVSPPTLISATLIADYPFEKLADVERSWNPIRRQLAADMASLGFDLESGHWDWMRKFRSKYLMEHRLFAIESESEVQGLMTLETQPRLSVAGKDSSLVYVDYIESAPWNLRLATQIPRFLGVGTLLIGQAVRESLRLQLDGRVGLHALPQAELFYSKTCRMTKRRNDPNYQNLAYFEYDDGVPTQWLVDKGLDR